jgi:hypothetical protein
MGMTSSTPELRMAMRLPPVLAGRQHIQMIYTCHEPHGSLPHIIAARHNGLLFLVGRSCAAQYFWSSLDKWVVT